MNLHKLRPDKFAPGTRVRIGRMWAEASGFTGMVVGRIEMGKWSYTKIVLDNKTSVYRDHVKAMPDEFDLL